MFQSLLGIFWNGVTQQLVVHLLVYLMSQLLLMMVIQQEIFIFHFLRKPHHEKSALG